MNGKGLPDVRLFVEGYGAPARARLSQLIDAAKEEDPLSPVTVVVPTTYAGLSLRRSLAKQKGLVNVRFMALPRLAEYLGAPALATQGKAPLSPIMKMAAIRHFASDMARKEPLGAIANHPPLHNYLMGTFTDLSVVSEEGLLNMENRSPLLKQVVEWFRLYRTLTLKYYDREDLAKAAADAVSNVDATSALDDLGFIIFYLLTNFSLGEMALVSALGTNKRCAVIVGLTGEQEVDAEPQRVATRLEPTLGEAKVVVPEQGTGSADHIVIAPDAHEEVRWVVRRIAVDAENGVPFHATAALYRNSDPYAALVKNQLEFAGIPAAGPDTLPIRNTPAGKLLVYMLEVFESDFAREKVMRWVAETPVRTGKDGELASRQLALWEAISGKAGIIKGYQQWKGRLDNFCKGMQEKTDSSETDENGELIAKTYYEIRQASAKRLKSFVDELATNIPPPDGSSWRGYADWAAKLIKKYSSDISWPKEEQDNYEKVISILGELGELDAIDTGGTTLSGFRQMLDDSLMVAVGRLGPTGSGVFVAPIGAVYGMEFDIVYILGMAEGAFPPTLPDDAIIPDIYRKNLGTADILRPRADRRIDERRTFRAAMAVGQRRVLSHPRSGGVGQRRCYPSPWLVGEAESLLQETAKGHGDSTKNTPDTAVSSANLEEYCREPWLSVIDSTHHGLKSLTEMGLVPADIHDYDMHSIARWHAAGHRIQSHFLMTQGSIGRRACDMEHSRREHAFTAWDGNTAQLAGKSARLGIPEHMQFSPTRLEMWVKCPFQYFMKHVLDIAVLDRPEEIIDISPIDRGRMIHAILEKFMKTVQGRKEEPGPSQPWAENHKELLTKIATEEFERVETLGITGRPLLWRVAQHEIMEDLSVFLKQDSRLRAENVSQTVAIEYKFGFTDDGQFPPVVITTRNGRRIAFRGIIDRVDADLTRSKVLVLDYKTGRPYAYSDLKKDDLLGAGKYLQLPVYAMAARGRFGDKCDITAMYWFITAKGGFEMKQVPLTEVETRFVELIDVIVSGIEAGLFPANPDSGGEKCAYCDYERVCPANADIAWERKSQDPQLAAYVAMTSKQTTREEAD